jgi:hypothetical protein
VFNWQGIYGAWVFFLLHAESKRDFMRDRALQACLNKVQRAMGLFGDEAPWGRVVDNLPEARRVYLALCKRFGRQPENIL